MGPYSLCGLTLPRCTRIRTNYVRPQWCIKRPSNSGNRFKPGASGRSRVCTSTTLAGRMTLEAVRHLPTYLQRDGVDRHGNLSREQHRQPDYAINPTGGLAAVAVSEMRAEKVSSRPEADIRFAIYILLSLNPENGESNLQGLPPDRLTKFLSDVRDKDLCKHLLQSELHVTIRLPVHA